MKQLSQRLLGPVTLVLLVLLLLLGRRPAPTARLSDDVLEEARALLQEQKLAEARQ